MDPVIVVAIIATLSPILTALVQYLTNKRKTGADIADQLAHAASTLIQPYKDETVQLRADKEALLMRIASLECELAKLRKMKGKQV